MLATLAAFTGGEKEASRSWISQQNIVLGPNVCNLIIPFVSMTLEYIAASYDNDASWQDSRAIIAKRIRR